MDIEQLREYCLKKKGTTEDFPFNQDTLVFKVLGKMYLLTSLPKWERGEAAINVKADLEYAEELRMGYGSIHPGYHMSKKHWNTIDIYKGELSTDFIFQLVDHSYNMVLKGMSKKMRDSLMD